MRCYNRLCLGPWRGDRGHSRQRRRAHRHQLFLQPERGRRDRRSLPQRRRRGGRGSGRRVARRGLPEDRGRGGAMGTARCADQQCRHHQARRARQSRRPVGGRFSAPVRRQHDRAVPDGARRASAAGSRRERIGPRVRGRERLVGCGHQRHRLFGRLCGEQGRAEHHDAVAGACAGAAHPRQHRMSRLYRYALVHQGPRRRRCGQGPRCRGRQGAAEGASTAEDVANVVCSSRRRNRAT